MLTRRALGAREQTVVQSAGNRPRMCFSKGLPYFQEKGCRMSTRSVLLAGSTERNYLDLINFI